LKLNMFQLWSYGTNWAITQKAGKAKAAKNNNT
jgi:hypothetical protein